MLIQDKVKNLTWFDIVNKLKDILLDILENIENLWSRIKALESFSNMPVYTNNAAAKAGGLTNGTVYKTSTGEVRVVV